jgi:hypothetical protein
LERVTRPSAFGPDAPGGLDYLVTEALDLRLEFLDLAEAVGDEHHQRIASVRKALEVG